MNAPFFLLYNKKPLKPLISTVLVHHQFERSKTILRIVLQFKVPARRGGSEENLTVRRSETENGAPKKHLQNASAFLEEPNGLDDI